MSQLVIAATAALLLALAGTSFAACPTASRLPPFSLNSLSSGPVGPWVQIPQTSSPFRVVEEDEDEWPAEISRVAVLASGDSFVAAHANGTGVFGTLYVSQVAQDPEVEFMKWPWVLQHNPPPDGEPGVEHPYLGNFAIGALEDGGFVVAVTYRNFFHQKRGSRWRTYRDIRSLTRRFHCNMSASDSAWTEVLSYAGAYGGFRAYIPRELSGVNGSNYALAQTRYHASGVRESAVFMNSDNFGTDELSTVVKGHVLAVCKKYTVPVSCPILLQGTRSVELDSGSPVAASTVNLLPRQSGAVTAVYSQRRAGRLHGLAAGTATYVRTVSAHGQHTTAKMLFENTEDARAVPLSPSLALVVWRDEPAPDQDVWISFTEGLCRFRCAPVVKAAVFNWGESEFSQVGATSEVVTAVADHCVRPARLVLHDNTAGEATLLYETWKTSANTSSGRCELVNTKMQRLTVTGSTVAATPGYPAQDVFADGCVRVSPELKMGFASDLSFEDSASIHQQLDVVSLQSPMGIGVVHPDDVTNTTIFRGIGYGSAQSVTPGRFCLLPEDTISMSNCFLAPLATVGGSGTGGHPRNRRSLFNLISFGSVTVAKASISGRVAVRDSLLVTNSLNVGTNADLGPGSLRMPRQFLTVGKNLTWYGSGQLHGDLARASNPRAFEYIAPQHIAYSRPKCTTCKIGAEDAARDIMISFQLFYASFPDVVQKSTGDPEVVRLSCGVDRPLYSVSFTPAEFSLIKSLGVRKDCNASAFWVVNIVGVGDVTMLGKDGDPCVFLCILRSS
jgi:Putative Ice-binding-like adhesive domain